MINFKKFNKKKLFKSRLTVSLVILFVTVMACLLLILVVDKNSKSKAKIVEKTSSKVIDLNPIKEIVSTESLWKSSIEEKVSKDAKDKEQKIEQMKSVIDKFKKEQEAKPKDDTAQVLMQKVANLSREIAALKSKKQIQIKEVPQAKNNNISTYVLNLDNSQNSKNYKAIKTSDNYIPAGAFAKAVLLSGVDAATSLNSSTDPDPVLIRIIDHGTLPRKFKSDLKDCHIIAAAYGDLSSERAKIRLEKLSCTEIATGEMIETQIVGYVTGEDGRAGVRGEVVSTEGKLLGNAMLAGVLGGLSNNFNPSTAYRQPGLFLNTKSGNTSKRVQNSLAEGASGSLDRLSKYYIDRAENLQPIVQIGAGRKVDVIFTEGVFFGTSEIKKAIAKKRDEKIKNKSTIIQQLR